MQLLSQNNNHIFICGQTRSGKTYFAGRALAELPGPVLFVNVQEEQLPGRFMQLPKSANFEQVRDCLRDGAKLDLHLPMDEERANAVIGLVLKNLMFSGFSEKRPVYVALDECHLLRGPALTYAVQAATRGLKRGVRCVFITQRPALCSKTLYTQAAEQYIFYLSPSEKEYLKNKGLDYDRCFQIWEEKGKYSYIYFDGFDLQGKEAV